MVTLLIAQASPTGRTADTRPSEYVVTGDAWVLSSQHYHCEGDSKLDFPYMRAEVRFTCDLNAYACFATMSSAPSCSQIRLTRTLQLPRYISV